MIESGAAVQQAYRGVKGWLKFFIVCNIYINPVLFVLYLIMFLIGIPSLVEKYLRIAAVGTLQMVIGGLLVWKWIQIARHLRQIEPGAVQETKSWLRLSLGLTMLSKSLDFMSGINAPVALLQQFTQTLIIAFIGFTIWYSYFSFSKRVKATYPDWSAPQHLVQQAEIKDGDISGVAPPDQTSCTKCNKVVDHHTYLNDVRGIGYLCSECTMELIKIRKATLSNQ